MSLSLHSPDDIPDDTILIQALKRGLIDPEAIVQRQEERNVAAGNSKVIPISVKRHTPRSIGDVESTAKPEARCFQWTEVSRQSIGMKGIGS